jgi:demethylmenaquinone methyltransferase/2-methoxy-6-polyprenyl-1,4-benzoquinol methylase
MESTNLLEKKPDQIGVMFDAVAPKYDLLNRLISFNSDIRTRKKLINLAHIKPGDQVCDLACGTGDLSILMAKQGAKVTGIDLSEQMLNYAKLKSQSENLSIEFKHQNILDIKEQNQFDLVTIGYGIRNLPNYENGLKVMYQILKTGGRVFVLEFSHPQNHFLKIFSGLYINKIAPFLSVLINPKAKFAYEYLPKSIQSFPDAETFKSLMTQVGFKEVKYQTLNLGMIAIHQGIK